MKNYTSSYHMAVQEYRDGRTAFYARNIARRVDLVGMSGKWSVWDWIMPPLRGKCYEVVLWLGPHCIGYNVRGDSPNAAAESMGYELLPDGIDAQFEVTRVPPCQQRCYPSHIRYLFPHAQI